MTHKETWLVAHDMSPLGEAAAHHAARMLGPHGGALRFVHIHAPLGGTRPEQAWGEETYALEKDVRAALEKLTETFKREYPKLEVSTEIITGDPVQGILGEAERQAANHIVLGTHGRTGVAHLVLGSVAEAIARKAACTVTIVKSAKK